MHPAHLSIHDVAPHTLDPVREMLAVLREAGIDRVMLLVIPGAPWQPEELEQLRNWAGQGHVLAGHGDTHHADRIDTFFHKLHAKLLSRDVAEHLSRSEDEIADLMLRNHAWFARHGLPAPTHYVPPAWALGRISRERLRELPFRTVEVLRGVLQVETGLLHRMPLLGYEADTAFRAGFLRSFNAWNLFRARQSGRCARISLHPYDLGYRLKDQILKDCGQFELQAEVPV